MNRLREAATRYTAPAGLRLRILEAEAEAATPARETSRRAWAGAAFAVLVLLAANVALLEAVPSKDDRIASDVTAGHVRSLLAARSVDVASSDQHTVKPWFAGKLDFAPPAGDFQGEGFPLVGGRLDYVDGERVAVLVYQHRKHVIDVFVSTAPGGAGAALSRRGYNLLHWTRDGLAYWAISDVDGASLEALRTLLARAASAPE
jgi:anti-sigma factor RsiW